MNEQIQIAEDSLRRLERLSSYQFFAWRYQVNQTRAAILQIDRNVPSDFSFLFLNLFISIFWQQLRKLVLQIVILN